MCWLHVWPSVDGSDGRIGIPGRVNDSIVRGQTFELGNLGINNFACIIHIPYTFIEYGTWVAQ